MSKWEPSGLVSRLYLPEKCTVSNVIAVWMPVGEVSANALPPELIDVPLVDVVEASTFVTQKRAAEHAAGRFALAALLRDIGFDPSKLQIIRDEYRKPSLAWRTSGTQKRDEVSYRPLPEITLGHSNGIAIAAISLDGSLIGLDAEPLDVPRPRNLLAMISSGAELQYLEQVWSNDERLGMEESTQTWVIKEAVQKACGLGMNVPPQSFSVLNSEQVILLHEKVEYRLDVVHWRELLGNRTFVFGFSRLIEASNSI